MSWQPSQRQNDQARCHGITTRLAVAEGAVCVTDALNLWFRCAMKNTMVDGEGLHFFEARNS